MKEYQAARAVAISYRDRDPIIFIDIYMIYMM